MSQIENGGISMVKSSPQLNVFLKIAQLNMRVIVPFSILSHSYLQFHNKNIQIDL